MNIHPNKLFCQKCGSQMVPTTPVIYNDMRNTPDKQRVSQITWYCHKCDNTYISFELNYIDPKETQLYLLRKEIIARLGSEASLLSTCYNHWKYASEYTQEATLPKEITDILDEYCRRRKEIG